MKKLGMLILGASVALSGCEKKVDDNFSDVTKNEIYENKSKIYDILLQKDFEENKQKEIQKLEKEIENFEESKEKIDGLQLNKGQLLKMLLSCSDFVDGHFSFGESNLECIRNEILKKGIEIPEDMTIYSKEYNKIIDGKIYKIIENIKFNGEKTIETIEEKSENE